MNVFYCCTRGYALVLRRAMLSRTGAWDTSDVDGYVDVGTVGAIYGAVGYDNSAVSIGNTLHVLYPAAVQFKPPVDASPVASVYAPVQIDDLRHARFDVGLPWKASTIDGAGGAAGRVAGETGAGVSVMLDAASQVQAFYFLGALTGRSGGFDLRHAELDWTGGNTQTWRFETLDGAGPTFANATGQLSAATAPRAFMSGRLPK
jgi:hypothetical protein